jgi:hypothetical protein
LLRLFGWLRSLSSVNLQNSANSVSLFRSLSSVNLQNSIHSPNSLKFAKLGKFDSVPQGFAKIWVT